MERGAWRASVHEVHNHKEPDMTNMCSTGLLTLSPVAEPFHSSRGSMEVMREERKILVRYLDLR